MMNNDINKLEIYREAMRLGEVVWGVVTAWDFFAKDTVGKQFVRAVDSIAANISEGYGRHHYKENIHFFHYARGSTEETQTWIEKSANRGLIEKTTARQLYRELNTLKKRLNAYIKTIGKSTTSKRTTTIASDQ
ncbi:MAG: four helix bundle protein [Verrucomicrobia bacterium]|nr:MAG: four helix bundle protein [Verrucomicrobiota bacterium]